MKIEKGKLKKEGYNTGGSGSPSKLEGVDAEGGRGRVLHTPQSLRDSSPNLGEQLGGSRREIRI